MNVGVKGGIREEREGHGLGREFVKVGVTEGVILIYSRLGRVESWVLRTYNSSLTDRK